MRDGLDPFYPVLPDAGLVARAVAAGARFVQLRAKDLPQEAARAEVRAALAAARAKGAALVVNDYWELAIEEGAPFVHLGQGDLDTADVAAIRKAGVKLGVSTHDEAELDRALALDPHHVALGPIFPTTLKAMPWAPQGLAKIGVWKRRIGDRPLVAIGGITAATAPDCLKAGADLAAAVTDLVQAADFEARVSAWIAATQAWR